MVTAMVPAVAAAAAAVVVSSFLVYQCFFLSAAFWCVGCRLLLVSFFTCSITAMEGGRVVVGGRRSSRAK